MEGLKNYRDENDSVMNDTVIEIIVTTVEAYEENKDEIIILLQKRLFAPPLERMIITNEERKKFNDLGHGATECYLELKRLKSVYPKLFNSALEKANIKNAKNYFKEIQNFMSTITTIFVLDERRLK